MESNRPIYIVELIDTKGWDWTYDHFYGPEKRVHLGAAEADAVAARLNTGDFNVWVDMDNDRFLEAEEKPVYRVIEIALGKLRALVEELRRCGRGYCEIEPGFYYDASESDLEKAEKLALQCEA